MIKRWHRSDVDVGQLWEKDGQVYKVVAIADSPTLTLQLLNGPPGNPWVSVQPQRPTRQTYVISSPNFAEFRRLDPQEPCN